MHVRVSEPDADVIDPARTRVFPRPKILGTQRTDGPTSDG